LLELGVDSTVFDVGELSAAIGKELDCPIVTDLAIPHGGELSITSIDGSRVSVTYRTTRAHEPLTRVVSLPRRKEERTQWVAWLVGNLARDEAADWLLDHAPENPSTKEVGRDAASGTATASTKPTEPPPSQSATAQTAQPLVPSASNGNQPTLTRRTFNLSIWYRWLQLRPSSAETRFTLHVGVGYGRVGAIRGIGFDLLHHRIDHELQGVGSSLIWTRAPQTRGLAWSAGVVTAGGRLRGMDLAWIFAYRDGSNSINQDKFATTLSEDVDIMGVQAGGIGSWSRGSFIGAQGAGVFTKHKGSLRGVQASLAANVSDEIVGAQISATNWANDVRGLQFGFVNHARHVDGVAVGLINISDNVRVQVQPWAERTYHENLGLRYAYEVLTFGYSVGYDANNERTRFLFGLGAIFPLSPVAFAPSVNVGFYGQKPHDGNPRTSGHENDLRFAVEWELVPRLLGIMGGPALALQSDAENHMRWVPRWFAGLTLL
jgi:hypothetical protein